MQNSTYTTRKAQLNKIHQFAIHKNEVDLSDPRYTETVHWHDFFELELVLSGEAIHVLNGTSYQVRPGSLYLLTPADLHTLIPLPNAKNTIFTVLNISFLDTIVSETSFVEIQTLPPPLTAEATGADMDDFFYMAQNMLSVKQARGAHYDDILCHLFLTFIFKFLRLYHLQHATTDIQELAQCSNRELVYIQNAISYIRYNFRDPSISITKIAAAVCLSSNYFGTIFKKYMGETCLSYIKKQRMSFATVLLQNSGLTIAEISEKCGYTNVPYFISDFRVTYGMPPKKYRDNTK